MCCVVLWLWPLLQRLLAGMRDRGATAAVLEVDSEAQATGSLQWVEPTIAVFTNSGEDPNSMFSSRQVRKQQRARGFAIAFEIVDACCTAHPGCIGLYGWEHGVVAV